MSRIKILIMDVDGTLTDGKIYISSRGELFKAFDVKDGYAIHTLLRSSGVEPVIITGRSSEIVKRRCEELKINRLYQGVSDKVQCLNAMLKELTECNGVPYRYENCAYIGDDIPDLECMKLIRAAGGVSACPADAVEEVKKHAEYVCTKAAGNGAVREFIEWLLA